MEAIAMSPTVSAESVDVLLDKFNWKTSNAMDAVAPIKSKMTLIRKKTPWRNTMMVKALKTECRKAECKWRKNKLQIHHDLYKISLCNFCEKIQSIRLNINTNQQNNKITQSLRPPRNNSTAMSELNTVDQKTIEKTHWMNQTFLQLNQDKTEVIVFGNKEKRIAVSKHLESLSLKLGTKSETGVLIDSDLTFSSHIKSITKTAFYQLKNISRVKGFMSQTDQEKLIHAFISSRLDY